MMKRIASAAAATIMNVLDRTGAMVRRQQRSIVQSSRPYREDLVHENECNKIPDILRDNRTKDFVLSGKTMPRRGIRVEQCTH